MPRVFGLIIAALYSTSTISAMIVPLESCRVSGIGCNIARPRTTTSFHQVPNAINGAKSQLEIISVGQDAATANVGSKNTTSTNTFGTSGSDVSSGDSDSSYTETESGNGTGADTPVTNRSTADASAAKSAFGSPAALSGLHNSRIFGKRQIGDISCNIARFQTVGRLAQASLAVNSVKIAASADPAAVAAADQAGTALNSAKDAIAKIAVALVTGQKAPAADRDQVQKGLNDATSALSGITSNDPKVTTAISNAQEKISSTFEAGNRVVSDC